MTLKIYSGTFLASFGFKVFSIFLITSFFFRIYDDLYFDKTWRIFSFSIFNFFVDSGTCSPSILEYWFTLSFSFYLISKSCETLIFGLWKSGKMLYFLGWWPTDMSWSNSFLLKADLGIKSYVERTLLVPFKDGKLDTFSDDPLN